MRTNNYPKHYLMRAVMTLLVVVLTSTSAWAQYVFVIGNPANGGEIRVGKSLDLGAYQDGSSLIDDALPGETVYFDFRPYKGYEFTGTITYDENLSSEDVTLRDDGIYSFTMPEYEGMIMIMIYVGFQKEQVVATGVNINEDNFPDANFRTWLLSQDYGKDAVITDAEMAGITKIVARGCGINNLTGIQFFTELTELDVSNSEEMHPVEQWNRISSVDLSGNTKLRVLWLDNNQMASIDLSPCSDLRILGINNNLLTELNVSDNEALSMLSCWNNLLTSLDVTNNQDLGVLACYGNRLTSLDVSQNLALEQLYCENNQLTTLNASDHNKLTILNCNDNQLTSLDVSGCTEMFQLYIYNNQLNGQAMQDLISNLPTPPRGGYMVVLDLENEAEQNTITDEQITAARAKTWSVEGIRGDVFEPLGNVTHEYVDLGLPSGTLWATCNVGASKPQDIGHFFAWGDTVGHGSDPSDGYLFSWDNYKWCVVVDYFSHFTKYCTESSSGNDGFADGKYELDPEDDAAYINWGSEWRTPSKEQFDELKNECTWTLKTIGDVKGYEVVGQNGNSIFLPETGWRIDDMLLDGGAYWARSANPEDTGGAYYLGWDDWGEYEYGGRVNGQCVRPVINPYKYIQLVDDAVNSDAIATAASSDDTYEVKLDGRTLFKDGEWNTLCLPFNLTAEQLSASPLAGADIRTLTSASVTGHHVDLTFGSNESSLTAGTPYIVRWEADTKIPTIIDPVFRGVTLSDEKHDFVSADGHVNFIGYYDAFTILPSDDPLVYYLTTGNILKFTTKERLLKACRTYFTFTPSDGSSANDFTFDISFGGDPNSIHTAITENDKTAGVWFDLSGRRLNGKPSQKGIYVTDGQKVVIQ